jgi:hypothetical protein
LPADGMIAAHYSHTAASACSVHRAVEKII